MNLLERKASNNRKKAILFLGWLVGTLDILAAVGDFYLSTGKSLLAVFKYISSAILGPSAFTGGTTIILLGILLHYTIAYLFTIFFVYLYTKTTFVVKNRLLSGILYGIFVWTTMYLVVSVSHTPKIQFSVFKTLKAQSILICMIGLPLAFLTGKFLKDEEEK